MSRSLAWVYGAPRDDLCLPPFTALDLSGASDKEHDKHLLSPPQPWTPVQLRTKSEMVLSGPQGSQRAPHFCSPHQKAGALRAMGEPHERGPRLKAGHLTPPAQWTENTVKEEGPVLGSPASTGTRPSAGPPPHMPVCPPSPPS